jgi:hypothetical protein
MSRRHSTIRENETDVSHESLIGAGGYGEVHKMLNNTTKQVHFLFLEEPFLSASSVPWLM